MNQKDQSYQVQSIRSQYVKQENGKLEELKKLDRRVRRPAEVFAWSFGTVAALVLGAGMSLIMTDLGQTLGLTESLLPGLVLGLLGLGMAVVNYPVYRSVLKARRKKFAPAILSLSDALMEA